MSALATRAVIAAAGLADLAATILQIVSYHAHAADLNIAIEFALLPWQALHAFTWFGALLYSSGAPGRSFGRMMLGAYVGAMVGDSISLIFRALLGRGSLFLAIAFWNTLALLFADGVAALFLLLAIGTDRDRDRDKPRAPWTETVARRILPWLWVLELLFFSLLVFVYTLGLNRTPEFSRIILLESPHAFVWLLHRVVTGGILRDDGVRGVGWYWLGGVASAGLALLGVGAGALRLYFTFAGADEPAALLPTLPIVWGWIQFGLGAALFAVATLQALSLGSIVGSERIEADLDEIVVTKIKMTK